MTNREIKESITFPKVSGKNLKRKKYHFPNDLPASLNIVLIAFYRQQQEDIDTWLPFAAKMEDKYTNVSYIELPVIYKMGPIRQFLLSEGMRAGIPDEKAREKTITLYLNKTRFLDQLGIDSEEMIQVMLVNDSGEVIWDEQGIFSDEKGSVLEKVLVKNTRSKIK